MLGSCPDQGPARLDREYECRNALGSAVPVRYAVLTGRSTLGTCGTCKELGKGSAAEFGTCGTCERPTCKPHLVSTSGTIAGEAFRVTAVSFNEARPPRFIKLDQRLKDEAEMLAGLGRLLEDKSYIHSGIFGFGRPGGGPLSYTDGFVDFLVSTWNAVPGLYVCASCRYGALLSTLGGVTNELATFQTRYHEQLKEASGRRDFQELKALLGVSASQVFQSVAGKAFARIMYGASELYWFVAEATVPLVEGAHCVFYGLIISDPQSYFAGRADEQRQMAILEKPFRPNRFRKKKLKITPPEAIHMKERKEGSPGFSGSCKSLIPERIDVGVIPAGSCIIYERGEVPSAKIRVDNGLSRTKYFVSNFVVAKPREPPRLASSSYSGYWFIGGRSK